MCMLVEHIIETHTVTPSSQYLAKATLVVKNFTVDLSEIKQMRTSFLITANRNISLQITEHQCKMSVQINRIHLFNNMSLKIRHCLFRNSHLVPVLFVSVAHVEPEHEM